MATDLSPAYVRAVRDNLRRVLHVFDHFPVIKLYNDKLSAFRRQLFHERTAGGQLLLKGVRWLLLRHPENLEPRKEEWQRREWALRLNEPLALVYLLKEYLRQLTLQESKSLARRFLQD